MNKTSSENKSSFEYKICIPYENLAMGGMYTFLFYFTEYLRKHNIAFTRNIFSKYDILLINSFMTPLTKVYIAKVLNPGLRIVQRIDGSAQDYGRDIKWDHKQKKINRCADLTIFQSQYGRHATREKFKVIAKDGPVIYNPVDITIFKPLQTTDPVSSRPRIAYVSFSTNPKKGSDSIFKVAQQNPDIDFVLIGRVRQQPHLNNITHTGHIGRWDVANVLGRCHMFLFFSQNEACPNVVLEAMASGLPVLYLNSGGTEELVGDTGLSITVESFREAFEKMQPCWHDWSRLARTRTERRFATDKVIPQYLRTMLEVESC